MTDSKRFLIIGFICTTLIVMAIYMYQLLSINGKSSMALPQQQVKLTNVKAFQFSTAGELGQSMTSPLLIHQTNSKNNIISHPIIKLIKDKHPWLIKADKAIIKQDNQQIILVGHVDIKEYHQGKVQSQLTTSKLYYYPQDKRLYTDKAIKYQKGGLKLTGHGLRANLNSEKFQLLSKTRGTYDPKIG